MEHKAAANGVKQILVIDDHPLVRAGYIALLERQPGRRICGEAANLSDAVQLTRSLQPDIALVDIVLEGCNGIELCKQLSSIRPRMGLLVISARSESIFALRALRAGAKGYIQKNEALDRLVDGVEAVLSGQLFLSDELTRQLICQTAEAATPLQDLSDRELEVFEWIGRGKTTRQIARQLHLSPKTVEAYRSALKRRLQIEPGELNRYAVHWSLESRCERPPQSE